MKILEEFQDWTSPKSNEIVAFTSLRTLNQGTLSLSEFITEATRLVDECGYTTDHDRLLRDTIVSGVQSKQAYQRCISKRKGLMLKDCIKICQSEDSKRKQVEALQPELKKIEIEADMHRLNSLNQGLYILTATEYAPHNLRT